MANRDLVLVFYGTAFVILLSVVTALPPDFFRNGRSKGTRLPTGKRNAMLGAESEFESIVTSACEYCQGQTGLQQLSIECASNPNIRRICLGAYVNTIYNMIDQLGGTWE